MKKITIFGASLLTISTFLFIYSVTNAQEKISLKGSDTLGAKLMPRLIEAYKTINPSISFEIEDKGSSTAFSNLLNATAHIGMSSRKIQDKELDKFTSKGLKINEYIAAVDMIAIIVNQANPLEDLEIEDIEEIFTGDVNNWSELGGKVGDISIYTRNTSSGTYKSFQKLAMNLRDYGSKTQKMEGNEQIANEVANNKNGIGYVGLAYSKKESLKKLKINGIIADAKNSQTYPFSRNLFYYTVGKPNKNVINFIKWCTTSEEAKKIIEEVGFLPPPIKNGKK